MAYSIHPKDIIDYPAEDLNQFYTYMFEWIDNLNFTISPFDVLNNAELYIDVAKKCFLEMGWNGDGEAELGSMKMNASNVCIEGRAKFKLEIDKIDFYMLDKTNSMMEHILCGTCLILMNQI